MDARRRARAIRGPPARKRARVTHGGGARACGRSAPEETRGFLQGPDAAIRRGARRAHVTPLAARGAPRGEPATGRAIDEARPPRSRGARAWRGVGATPRGMRAPRGRGRFGGTRRRGRRESACGRARRAWRSPPRAHSTLRSRIPMKCGQVTAHGSRGCVARRGPARDEAAPRPSRGPSSHCAHHASSPRRARRRNEPPSASSSPPASFRRIITRPPRGLIIGDSILNHRSSLDAGLMGMMRVNGKWGEHGGRRARAQAPRAWRPAARTLRRGRPGAKGAGRGAAARRGGRDVAWRRRRARMHRQAVGCSWGARADAARCSGAVRIES